MRFEVRAMSNGRVDSLVIEAMDLADARREVLSRSIQVLSIKPVRALKIPSITSASPEFPVDFFVCRDRSFAEPDSSVAGCHYSRW